MDEKTDGVTKIHLDKLSFVCYYVYMMRKQRKNIYYE